MDGKKRHERKLGDYYVVNLILVQSVYNFDYSFGVVVIFGYKNSTFNPSTLIIQTFSNS